MLVKWISVKVYWKDAVDVRQQDYMSVELMVILECRKLILVKGPSVASQHLWIIIKRKRGWRSLYSFLKNHLIQISVKAVTWLRKKLWYFYEAGIYDLVQRWHTPIEKEAHHAEDLIMNLETTLFIFLCFVFFYYEFC